MSIAENMLLGVIKQMGIAPGDIAKVVVVIDRMNSLVGEMDDFKTAAAAWLKHFDARFDAIEARLKRAEDIARISVTSTGDHHERNHPNGHG
jgi:hypothetical protein